MDNQVADAFDIAAATAILNETGTAVIPMKDGSKVHVSTGFMPFPKKPHDGFPYPNPKDPENFAHTTYGGGGPGVLQDATAAIAQSAQTHSAMGIYDAYNGLPKGQLSDQWDHQKQSILDAMQKQAASSQTLTGQLGAAGQQDKNAFAKPDLTNLLYTRLRMGYPQLKERGVSIEKVIPLGDAVATVIVTNGKVVTILDEDAKLYPSDRIIASILAVLS